MVLTDEDLSKLIELFGKLLEKKLKNLANKDDIAGLETKIAGLKAKISDLEDRTVKYKDIAELFEAFEEKIKDDITKDIILIKQHLHLNE